MESTSTMIIWCLSNPAAPWLKVVSYIYWDLRYGTRWKSQDELYTLDGICFFLEKYKALLRLKFGQNIQFVVWSRGLYTIILLSQSLSSSSLSCQLCGTLRFNSVFTFVSIDDSTLFVASFVSTGDSELERFVAFKSCSCSTWTLNAIQSTISGKKNCISGLNLRFLQISFCPCSGWNNFTNVIQNVISFEIDRYRYTGWIPNDATVWSWLESKMELLRQLDLFKTVEKRVCRCQSTSDYSLVVRSWLELTN